MGHIICIANQKGGVGKTTTVVAFAAYLGQAGLRCLVIDNDPQGNASSVFAPDYSDGCVYGDFRIHESDSPGVSIIGFGNDLLSYEQILTRRRTGNGSLTEILAPLRDEYDVILIDCPPSLGILPTNALLAADTLIVPLQCEYYALEGLGQIMEKVDELDCPKRMRILLTMMIESEAAHQQIRVDIQSHFGDGVFDQAIPRDTSLALAPSHGQSILAYDPLSPGSLAYLAASKELINDIR